MNASKHKRPKRPVPAMLSSPNAAGPSNGARGRQAHQVRTRPGNHADAMTPLKEAVLAAHVAAPFHRHRST